MRGRRLPPPLENFFASASGYARCYHPPKNAGKSVIDRMWSPAHSRGPAIIHNQAKYNLRRINTSPGNSGSHLLFSYHHLMTEKLMLEGFFATSSVG